MSLVLFHKHSYHRAFALAGSSAWNICFPQIFPWLDPSYLVFSAADCSSESPSLPIISKGPLVPEAHLHLQYYPSISLHFSPFIALITIFLTCPMMTTPTGMSAERRQVTCLSWFLSQPLPSTMERAALTSPQCLSPPPSQAGVGYPLPPGRWSFSRGVFSLWCRGPNSLAV